MIMNSIEYWAMNNQVRALVQRYYEAPRLRRLFSGSADVVLEIGCGQGVGAEIIERLFRPQRYVGIDLDPRMIRRARLRRQRLQHVTFLQGDASSLAFAEAAFDLVIDFGIIHHIPSWPDALAEIHRILPYEGVFLFEELSLETWEKGMGKKLKPMLDHPYDQMFRRQEFIDQMDGLGFDVVTYQDAPASFEYFWGSATKRA